MTEDRWVIRNVEDTVRDAAVEAARRADMTVANWIGLAVAEKIAREREVVLEGEVVNLFDVSEPAAAGDLNQDRSVHMLIEPMQPPSIDEIGCAVDVAEKIARLSGRKLPRRIAARANALLLRRLSLLPPPSRSD
jgi:hypothetical protein